MNNTPFKRKAFICKISNPLMLVLFLNLFLSYFIEPDQALGINYENYWVIADHHDKQLHYNFTGGDRGLLNEGEVSYSWDGNSAYTATATTLPGSHTHTWGGMWYSLIRIDNDDIPLDFKAIFGPYVKPEYQGEITDIEVVVSKVQSPSINNRLQLRLELKDRDNNVIDSMEWNLEIGSTPQTFLWTLTDTAKKNVEKVLWVMDKALIGDAVTVDRVGMKARVPDEASIPTENQAFLWSYSWLMTNYDPESGMVQDRSRFPNGTFENVTATGKAAKIVYYAYKKGVSTYENAVAVITKIADTLTRKVTRGPDEKGLWPHFTSNGGSEIKPNTEWASGDTAFAALDIITALQIIGDPQGQIPALENFLKAIDWNALLVEDGTISHGFKYDKTRISDSWKGFGMETMGVNWAYASATGNFTPMLNPPSDNGSGFIDQAGFPLAFSGFDRWGNDWDAYRKMMADTQIGWYTSEKNFYLHDAGLFGLSAAEDPEGNGYIVYGVGGRVSTAEDGNGEVIVLHYAGMISDIRLNQAKHVWEALRDQTPSFFQNQDKIVISPLNNMESMRVNKNNGSSTINYLKGSWNLALQAEGWALSDPIIRNDLVAAIHKNAFLRNGYRILSRGFSDVPQSHWADTYIAAIYHALITRGCSQNPLMYCPDNTVTRDQMAAFIIRAKEGENFSYSSGPYFNDVPASHWAFKYIQRLKELGITTGCGIGNYCPDNTVTRDQMAAFLVRAKEGEDFSYSTTPYFSDVASDYWAFKYIQRLKELGITTGCASGMYCPTNAVTRDQMAAFLARAFLGMQ